MLRARLLDPIQRCGPLLGLLLAALLVACEDPQPPAAPFGARNLLPLRDSNVQLYWFNQSRTRLFYSRAVARYDEWTPSLGNQLFDLWAIDLPSSKSELVAEKVRWFFALPSDGLQELYGFVRQVREEDSAPKILTLLDAQSGARQDYEAVLPSTIAWSEKWIVFIRYQAMFRELWAGPSMAPQKVSGALHVHDWAWLGRDQIALGASQSVAGLPSGSDPIPATDKTPSIAAVDDPTTKAGIYRLDIPSGALTEEVPARIETASWAGADPAPPLSSSGLCCGLATLTGSCWSKTETKAWGAADQRCYLLYQRQMSDETIRVFVYDPDSRRETALSASQAFDQWFSVPGGWARSLPWFSGNGPMATFYGASGTPTATTAQFLWDAETERELSCALQGRGYSAWRHDGRALAYANQTNAFIIRSDALTCEALPAADGWSFFFSPDGSRLLWSSPSGLWQADGGGQNARLVVANPDLSPYDFLDQRRILALYDSADGAGLVWIDLDDPAPTEEPVAEQLFGTQYYLNARFRALGNRYNAQDQTGVLSLVDVDDFALTTLAEAAADHTLGWPPAADAPSFPFAYLKVGRFASEQDGIWVGWIARERIEAP